MFNARFDWRQIVESASHDVPIGLADGREHAAVKANLLDTDALVQVPGDCRMAQGVTGDLLFILGRMTPRRLRGRVGALQIHVVSAI